MRAIESQYLFNGKEQQSELGLGWIDYGARMYNPQLGRWPVIDPLAEKWHVVSPFTYALNNPMLFVDPDGRDNVVYLQVQKSAEQDFSKKELRGIRNEANANFKRLGLQTRVHLAKGTVNYNKLDKTDAVAVIGRGSDVIGAVSKMNKAFAGELQLFKFGQEHSNNPEISQNDQGRGGNIIALDSRAIKQISSSLGVSKEAYGGFTINHGAGHNAGIGDEGNAVGFKGFNGTVPTLSIMADGNTQAAMMRGPAGTQSLINTADNLDRTGSEVIQGKLRERFDDHVSTPHLPTIP